MSNKTKWSIDLIHSKLSFKIRHLMISNIQGQFKKYDASIYTTGTDFTTAEMDVWIDPTSIDTGDAQRDEHLQGIDFLDVANHKQISFTSNTIEKKGNDGEHELWGDLTIKGLTKRIMLKVDFGGMATDAYGRKKAGFTVQGKINRSDWGLVWNSSVETGGLLIGDELKISCEVELIHLGSEDDNMILDHTVGKATI